MPSRSSIERPAAAWRLVPRRRAATAFDGEGARLYGGRWNHPGSAVVYTSSHLSLAALEVFVHADPDIAPLDLVAIRLELPAGTAIERVEFDELPPDWRAYPGPEALRDLGSDWLRRGETAALAVPSAVIPQELNLLLAPRHPLLVELHPEPPVPFSFDPRMWKGAAALPE